MDTKESGAQSVKEDIILDMGQTNALHVLNSLRTHIQKRKSLVSWSLGGFKKSKPKQGVYLHGDVGRGKTMLMDMFYEALPETYPKDRVHFHAFMRDVHDFLHVERQKTTKNGVDKALPKFAKTIARRTKILCFDEFHVTDVVDAMILSRLFTALFNKGVHIVMTSNWHPDHLYKDGLQRDRFVPFIALIKTKMNVVEFDGAIDYRRQTLKGRPVYFFPLGEATDHALQDTLDVLTHGKEKHSCTLTIKNRDIEVKESYGDVALFTFHDLCETPLGAEDYLEIAKTFKIIVLKDIPKLTTEKRNEAKRFITLIDILYDAHTLLIITAETDPSTLYTGHDHALEFDRTISRLSEMQSISYLN